MRARTTLLSLLALSTILALPAVAGSAGASSNSFEVSSTLDEPDALVGDGICSSTPSGECTLRAAVEEGQYSGVAVEADDERYLLSLGHLWVKPGMTLRLAGQGSKKTVIDGQGQWRVFDISATGSAYVSGVTITGGAGGRSDAFTSHDHGGGIHNHGRLELSNSAVYGNGVHKATGQRSGAGLTNASGATAVLYNVTLSDNFNFFADGKGGAIENLGTLRAEHTTIVNNAASAGGGLYLRSGNADLYATIVGLNSGYNCAGTVTPLGTIADIAVLADDSSCQLTRTGSVNGATLGLGDWDAKQRVWKLAAGSPAIDALAGPCALGTDQTGRARPQDGNGDGVAACDLGAWEAPRPRR